MKKKILFVIDSLACAGAEKSLVTILQLLDYDTIDVELMLVQSGGLLYNSVPSNVKIKSISKPKGISRLKFNILQKMYSLLFRIYALLGIKKNNVELLWSVMRNAYPVQQQEYDVAVAFQQGFSTYYVTEKIRANKKIAWINNDLKKEGFKEEFNRKYYDNMDAVVAVSDILCNILKNSRYVESEKLRTIYDILDADKIRLLAKEKGFEDTLPHDTWRIVTVGRLAAQKNYCLAVHTAKLLKESGLKFRWYFIGDGPQYNHIQGLVNRLGLEQEVILLGMKVNPYPYMSECDIYVQTSSHEGYGMTLCEARILHKPEISTNFPVAKNHINDGVNGLVAKMTPKSVADCIIRIANDSILRERIISVTKKELHNTKNSELPKIKDLLFN